MNVNGDASGIERSYLRFDVSDLPAAAIIRSATLNLCLVSNPAPAAVGRIHQLRRAASGWTEGGLTWLNQPSFFPDPSQPSLTVPSTAGCLTLNVKTDVQSWVSGSAPNFGWRFADKSETSAGSSRVSYATREHANAGLRPTLDVVYTMP